MPVGRAHDQASPGHRNAQGVVDQTSPADDAERLVHPTQTLTATAGDDDEVGKRCTSIGHRPHPVTVDGPAGTTTVPTPFTKPSVPRPTWVNWLWLLILVLVVYAVNTAILALMQLARAAARDAGPSRSRPMRLR